MSTTEKITTSTLENITFREYLIWKEPNLKMKELLNRLGKADNSEHIINILKNVLYAGNRFQFYDYTAYYLELLITHPTLSKLTEITVYWQHKYLSDFDTMIISRMLFYLEQSAIVLGKTLKITDDINADINLTGWIETNRGYNDDYLNVCFHNKAHKKPIKLIHYLESRFYEQNTNISKSQSVRK